MEVISAEKIFKEYTSSGQQVSIINNISINIKRGDFLSIVGPSGSGKSTLLYLLSGMEEVTSGSVRLLGKELKTISDKEMSVIRQKDIGFIFQFYNLIQEMTVDDNIILSNLIGKDKINYDRLNELLDLVDLKNHRSKYPNELSGGQQQRVAIARALYNNPSIIFADEPTGNLDSKNSEIIMELLKMINVTYNTTIILVTHNEVQSKYANKIVRIRDGEIVNDSSESQ